VYDILVLSGVISSNSPLVPLLNNLLKIKVVYTLILRANIDIVDINNYTVNLFFKYLLSKILKYIPAIEVKHINV